MKVVLKTIKQEQFEIEVEPSETIADLKRKVQETKGHEAGWQKLIYSGRVLDDNLILGSLNFGANDFLVLMVRKPKEAEAPKVTPAPAPVPAVASVPAAAPPSSLSAPVPAVAVAPAPASPAPEAEKSNNEFVVGSELDNIVQRIVDMGFEPDLVRRALRASFNNPDRAVEYLTMGGIPDVDEPPSPVAVPAGAGGAGGRSLASGPAVPPIPAPGAGGAGGAAENLFELAANAARRQSQGQNPFSALRNDPLMQQLRALVQTQPQTLQPIIQQIGAQNPELFNYISQHQEEFTQFLNEPIEGADLQSLLSSVGGGGAAGPAPALTPEDRAAIERLEGLGFPRASVIEAYLSCDKDENLAANFLLESGGAIWEDDDGAMEDDQD